MSIELWAGAECTVNRVGDRYFDQSLRTGHHERLEDIDRLAELGVTRVRFPVLLERVAPDGLEHADFAWCDARLQRLRALGIRPIVGLIHHGSGPRYATLDTERFSSTLASFAHMVAARYPWVDAFTPINEPLTTARFCGLYAHWFPHARDTASFLRLLVNEAHATASAMAAIRSITPAAQLVQTEDFGRTFGTPALERQCEYEAHRRWLSLDLLAGRVTVEHPLREHLEAHAIAERELDALADAPCAPDIVGINYYVTSDRFLDERIERYPVSSHGGNAWQRYADVEAVRVRGEGIAGHAQVIRETWQRYHLPIALTEVHLGCTREEQLRWLAEAWSAAHATRAEGADVRALTLWSSFGAIDWSSLLTRDNGHYEPGVYDIRGSVPRATAIARMAQKLSSGRSVEHPVLSTPGWWRRPERFAYPVHYTTRSARSFRPRARAHSTRGPHILAVGDGVVGDGLIKLALQRGLAMKRVRTIAEATVALSNEPWAVAIEPVGERDFDGALARRRTLTRLAQTCAERDIQVLLFSNDRVFDGRSESAYSESDQPAPQCAQGHAQHGVESAVQLGFERALVLRTGPLLEPTHPQCRLAGMLRALLAGQPQHALRDEIVSPALLSHALHAALDLLVDREQGVWHLASEQSVSWSLLLKAALQRIASSHVHALSAREEHIVPRAPFMRALSSQRGYLLPSMSATLDTYIAAFATSARQSAA